MGKHISHPYLAADLMDVFTISEIKDIFLLLSVNTPHPCFCMHKLTTTPKTTRQESTSINYSGQHQLNTRRVTCQMIIRSMGSCFRYTVLLWKSLDIKNAGMFTTWFTMFVDLPTACHCMLGRIVWRDSRF